MKHLRVTLRPHGTTIHPVYDVLVGDAVSSARMLHWNVADDTPTILFHLDSDPDAVATALDDIPAVIAYDLTPVGNGTYYLYLHEEPTEVEWTLSAAFTGDGMLVVPPLVYTDDGGVRFAVLGDPDDLRAALDLLPDGLDATVERVGEYDVPPPDVTAVLTERQHAAVDAATELGYYEVPRRATHEDVAERLGCAPSTASEHLRKANARVMTALFDRR